MGANWKEPDNFVQHNFLIVNLVNSTMVCARITGKKKSKKASSDICDGPFQRTAELIA